MMMTMKMHEGSNLSNFNFSSFLLLFWIWMMSAVVVVSGSASSAASAIDIPNIEESLTEFFDSVVPNLLQEHQVPGASIAVVTPNNNDDIQTFSYGYSILANDKEEEEDSEEDVVVTSTTPFASGSVAKLFVWTSIMQLYEQGLIVNLDDPISNYLDFEFPQRRLLLKESPEITIANLMTHSSGFEDYPMIGSFTRDAEDIPDLGDFLSQNIPQQDFIAGKEMAYSNYGSGLAGYIVELVSGLPYDEYVTTNILKPLQMDCTSVNLPLSSSSKDNKEFQSTYKIAKGYKALGDDDKYEWFGNEYLILYPAGHLEMCAIDAGKFMKAYLQDGSLDYTNQTRILLPSTVQLMQNSSSLFRNLPFLPGNSYGFWENQRNGQYILNHMGDISAFASHLALLPHLGIGYYLTTNGNRGTLVRNDLWNIFIDKYFPPPPLDPTPLPTTTDNTDLDLDYLDQFVGYYASNRMSSTSMSKIVSLLQTVKVTKKKVDKEGNPLTVTGFGSEWTLIPKTKTDDDDGDGNGNGEEEEGQGRYAAHRFYDQDRNNEEFVFTTTFIKNNNKNKVVDGLYLSEYPSMVFHPVSKIRSPTAQMILLMIGIILCLSGLFVFPIQIYYNSKRKQQQQQEEEEENGSDGDNNNNNNKGKDNNNNNNKNNNVVDPTHDDSNDDDQEEEEEMEKKQQQHNRDVDGEKEEEEEEEEEPSEEEDEEQQQQQQQQQQTMMMTEDVNVEQSTNDDEKRTTEESAKEESSLLLMMNMRLRWIGSLTCLFLILFGILYSLDMMMGYPQFQPSPTLKTALVFGYIGTFLLLFLFTPLVFIDWWYNKYGCFCCKLSSPYTRIHMAFVLLGGWILVSIMIYWKMIFGRV